MDERRQVGIPSEEMVAAVAGVVRRCDTDTYERPSKAVGFETRQTLEESGAGDSTYHGSPPALATRLPRTRMHAQNLPKDESCQDLGQVVTIQLLERQAEDLWPIVRRQVDDKKGLIFYSVAPYLTMKPGCVQLRMQAVFVPHPKANKILKLIQSEITPKP